MHKHSETIENGFNGARTDFPTKIIRRWAWSIKRFLDQDQITLFYEIMAYVQFKTFFNVTVLDQQIHFYKFTLKSNSLIIDLKYYLCS